MKIAVHGRTFTEQARPFVQEMFDKLFEQKTELIVSSSYRAVLDQQTITHYSEQIYDEKVGVSGADFIFSLGGDGTLLEAVTHVGERQTPIVGINTGRLGFLATVSPSRIQYLLHVLFNQKFRIEDRSLVHIASDCDLFGRLNFGLNDMVISKTDTSSMLTVQTYLNGEFLNAYWADGLIVSTPTGSTGYSLSAGGPVLLPTNESFIIAPLSPHNLNVRPMILPDSSVLSFDVQSRSGSYLLSLDARSKVVDASTKLTLRKENFVARLVKTADDSFLNTLRNKLSWGYDVRN